MFDLFCILYFFLLHTSSCARLSFRFYYCCKTKQVCWGRWRFILLVTLRGLIRGCRCVDDTVESRSHGEVKQVAAKLHNCQQPLGSTVLLSLFGETQRCHWCRGLFVGGTPCQLKKLRQLTLSCKGPNSKHGKLHIYIQCFLSTMWPLFQKCVVTWRENVAFAALSLAVRTTLSNFKSQFITEYAAIRGKYFMI